MAALLALLSSALWGVSDFVGGSISRRLPLASVLGLSQLAALLLLTPLVYVTGAVNAPHDYLVPGVVAGLAAVIGLAAFFRALSIGTMGVVAPIAALGVAVPVVAGLVRGERPAALQIVGMVVAVIGVVLASGPELSGSAGVTPLLLAVLAALGFGSVFVLIAIASQDDSRAVLMTLLTMRLTGVVVLSAVLLVTRRWRGAALGVARGDVPVLVALAAADVGANAAYGLSSRIGLVSVVAVLASLYPVVTAVLAYRFLGERLGRIQLLGVGVTLVGIVALAAG